MTSQRHDRIVSLLEMLTVYGVIFNLLDVVRYCRAFLETEASRPVFGSVPINIVPYPQRDMLRQFLTSTESICTKHEIRSALDRIARIKTLLDNPNCTYPEMIRQYQTLYENIEDDLRLRRFWYFSSAKVELATTASDIPFKDGPDLAQARYEWAQAQWAYGFELNTACVFHLMRLSELGLRALGRKLGITLKRAIEFEDWKPILVAVDKKLADLENEPRTEERARDLKFYSDAGKELLYFKNLWRDGGAHAREVYDENDAKKAMDRVYDFMKLLAEKLDQVS